MEKVELKVKDRESFGSAEARRMRKEGWIPGVLYGGGNNSVPLAIEEKALKRALGRDAGGHIINLTFEGKKKGHNVILKEYQADPLGNGILHVDFLEIRMDQPVDSQIRVELTGTALGVREGGILDQSLREVTVRCLPANIPESVAFDVENMQIGDSIKVADLIKPDDCEILNDPETQVASIIPPTILKEVVPAEEEEVEEAEAAAAEGEAEEKPAEAGEEAKGEG